jgi:hypothetical protein
MSKRASKGELSAVEAARAAGVRLDGLYVTLRSGKIPARKGSDGEWRIAASDFEKYLAQP